MTVSGFSKAFIRLAGASCIGIAFAGATIVSSRADDMTWPASGFQTEFGMRYWANWGSTGYDLYGPNHSVLLSRLTFGDLTGNAGEVFGQITDNRYFVKGFAGLGSLGGGNLQDEDFPPFTFPYSSTDSDQHSGSIGYVTLDIGRYFAETQNSRIGGFVGYNYLNQQVNAYGCTQTATNPFICMPMIPGSIEAISENHDWNSVRVGMNGETHFGKWTLHGDAAVLPYVSLSGADTHHLRIGCSFPSCFTGPVPQDGTGWGYQLEAMLDYQVNPGLSLGIGTRYWHMETSGDMHFEGHVVGGGIAQGLDWKTDLFGVTAHAALHF